ncbi:MAG: caspase family protein [Lewinellaceae bacterium]|nr:caspase family protein [Lewinellaceae bacterium]
MNSYKGIASRNNLDPEHNYPSGKNYLLIIAIDDYRNGITPLNNAVKDALEFRELLVKQYQFDRENVITLTNQDATKEAIIEAFDKLYKLLTDQDNLVFFYSGHGEYYQPIQRGFWIPSDAKLEKRTTYISNADIVDYIKVFKARHVLGIVDSCFAAALFAQKKLRPEDSRYYSLPSRYLITAGRLEPVSDGSLGANSPFAKSLMNQLRYLSADHIWTSELAFKVIHAIQFNIEGQLPQGEPLQNVGHEGGEFVFLRKGRPVPIVDFLDDLMEAPTPTQTKSKNELATSHTQTLKTHPEQIDEPLTLPQLKSYLKNLAAKNLEKALDDVNSRLRDNSYMVNNFILLSAQFNQLKGDKARGIIPYNDSVVRQNQIIDSFQSLVDDLEDEDIRW